MIRVRRVTRTTKDPESNIEKIIDLGFVGEPSAVDPHILDVLKGSDIIPVIAPIGIDEAGQTFNINADTVAGAVAGAVGATRLLLLTDVAGGLDQTGRPIPELTSHRAGGAVPDGTSQGCKGA